MNSSLKIGYRKSTGDTVSFRIDNKLKLVLGEEARKKGITLNTLVSHIFGNYALWGRYAEELRLIPFNKDVLRELFKAVNPPSIEEIAEVMGKTVGREEIIFLFNDVNPETVLRYIEVRGKHFSAYHHWLREGKHHFTLQHDLGLNFSLFMKEYLASMLRATLRRRMEFSDVSPNSLSFSIPLSSGE